MKRPEGNTIQVEHAELNNEKENHYILGRNRDGHSMLIGYSPDVGI